ncbi:MAG: hypothetical protein EXR71_00355 [Myxococcales bacterium]|nr:hypothetical protein [Myxococcales bacterium]
MLLLLLTTALAGNAEVGGAVDLIAGVAFAGQTNVASFGVQQAEGDLKVGGDGFAFVMQLDMAATLSGDGLLLYSLAPERLTVEGTGRGWRAWGGVFPGFFRLESVDPWRRQAVVASMASARVPGAVLGGGADFGGTKGGVSLLLGFSPATVDVFRFDDIGPSSLPLLAGARGRAMFSMVEVAGGAWFGGGFDAFGFGGLELGSVIDLGVVVPYLEFVSDLSAGHSGFVGADLFPAAIVSPGARVELDSVRGFGVGVSVASTAFEILRLKGEASYQGGNPGVYLEVAVMSKAPVDDDRFGRAPLPKPTPKPKKQSAPD